MFNFFKRKKDKLSNSPDSTGSTNFTVDTNSSVQNNDDSLQTEVEKNEDTAVDDISKDYSILNELDSLEEVDCDSYLSEETDSCNEESGSGESGSVETEENGSVENSSVESGSPEDLEKEEYGDSKDVIPEDTENIPDGIKEISTLLEEDSIQEESNDENAEAITGLFDDIINEKNNSDSLDELNDDEDDSTTDEVSSDNSDFTFGEDLSDDFYSTTAESLADNSDLYEDHDDVQENTDITDDLEKPEFLNNERIAIEFTSIENVDLSKYDKIDCQISNNNFIIEDKEKFVFDGSVKFYVIFDDKLSENVVLDKVLANKLSKGCYEGFNVVLNAIDENLDCINCYKRFNYSYIKNNVLVIQIIFTL